MPRRRRPHRRTGLLFAAAIALAVPAATAPTAGATFPGENGRIIFDTFDRGAIFAADEVGGIRSVVSSGFMGSASPSGDLLTYSGEGGIYVRDLETRDRRRLTSWPGGLNADREPAFLGPAGARILFSSSRNGSGGLDRNASIWSMNPDGSDLRQLTRLGDEHLYDSVPESSPDGSLVAFSRVLRPRAAGPPHDSEIYLMDPDGTGVRRLTFTGGRGGAYDPSFSPDGRRILFTIIRRQTAVLATISVHGGRLRRISEPREGFDNGVYSPDGRRIVARDTAQGRDTSEPLVTMDLWGNNRIRITPNRLEYPFPSDWAPR